RRQLPTAGPCRLLRKTFHQVRSHSAFLSRLRPRGSAYLSQSDSPLDQRQDLDEIGTPKEAKLSGAHSLSETQRTHPAVAVFPSPFEEAAFLTVDGVGEWTTTSYGTGRGNHIEIQGELHFPHSLGLLYSAFTYYTGFKVNSGEYKLMGLAPYGEPKYVDLILK